jgi:two-component system, NarL family, sensor histidine kinase DesK
MPLISRWRSWAAGPGPGAAGPGDPPDWLADDLDRDIEWSLARRHLILRVMIVAFLLLPAVILISQGKAASHGALLFAGTVVFVVLVDRAVLTTRRVPERRSRGALLLVPVIVLLGAALFALGQMNWLTALAVAAAAAGRFSLSRRVAIAAVAGCAVLGFAITSGEHLGYGNAVISTLLPGLAGLLAHNAERRMALLRRLKETRAGLAGMAVAEERLRIARDLHDLLGHSLSLIALKTELAGRLIAADPDRAAREIADAEAVARRSLTEVRQAVTGYRQPRLATELTAARRMLASAGIDCRLEVPGTYALPPAVDALLAWTVREGVTNMVRHSGARHARITVEVTGARAEAVLADDGAGPPTPTGPPLTAEGLPGAEKLPGTERLPRAEGLPGGSGLAGLAERAARLGGALSAGAAGKAGFRLLVSVPLPGTGAEPGTGPESGTAPGTAAAPGSGLGGRVSGGRVPGARPGRDAAPPQPDAASPERVGP